MLNSILETRERINGLYRLTLHINDDDYFTAYDSLNDEDAAELLKNYLDFRADDGKPDNVRLKHSKNEHVVTIQADLSYAGNAKTEEMYRKNDHLRHYS